MKHKKLHTLAVIVMVFVVAVGGWYLYANTLGKPLFSGETFHDFGVVLLDNEPTTVSHTFKLTNNTDEIIMVQDIISNCKCTLPKMDDRRVLPGTTLDLAAELTVSESGLMKSDITIILDDKRYQRLGIQAIGRRRLPLTYIGRHIELLMNLPKILGVRCEIYNDLNEPPPSPIVKTGAGITASFKRWKLVDTYNEKWMNPAIWEAELILTRTRLELDPDTAIDVSLDGEIWLSVPVNRPDLVEEIEYHAPPAGGEAEH